MPSDASTVTSLFSPRPLSPPSMITRSPASRNVPGRIKNSFQALPRLAKYAAMPSLPRKISLSMATIEGDHSKSDVVSLVKASTSILLKASIARLAISAFSRAIAYPDSAMSRIAGAPGIARAVFRSEAFGLQEYDRRVTLYVCYGTFGPAERHACARAHKALVAAGHSPKVSRTYGCYRTDPLFGGRRHVKRLTGNFEVPTLVLDDGAVIDGSREIAAWAAANPA